MQVSYFGHQVSDIENHFRRGASTAEFQLQGICLECKHTLSCSQIKNAAEALESARPTFYIPCSNCNRGLVDVSFIVKSCGIVRISEFYGTQQLGKAIAEFARDTGDNWKRNKFSELAMQAPELLWNLCFHFGYENGLSILEAF